MDDVKDFRWDTPVTVNDLIYVAYDRVAQMFLERIVR